MILEYFYRSNLPNISTICEDDYSLNSNKYLRFKPQKLSSILFYSQTSNFNLDYLSLHGSCPVLSKVIHKFYISSFLFLLFFFIFFFI